MPCLDFACGLKGFSRGSLLADDHLTPTLESRLLKGGMEKWKRETEREKEGGREREGEREGEKDWERRLSCVEGEWRYLEGRSTETINLLQASGKEIPPPLCASVPSSMKWRNRIRWPEILSRASSSIQCLNCSLELQLILNIYRLTKTMKPLLTGLTWPSVLSFHQ